MTRRLRSCLALFALTGSLFVGLAARPAEAAVLDMTCTTQQRTTYSPGVTLFPSQQTIQVTAISNPCVSATRPDITAGFASVALQGMRSCLSLGDTGGGTSGIQWNTGETSVYTYTSTSQTIAGQIVLTITGVVTSGVFRGDTIALVLVSPAINVLSCLLPPGITSRIGVGTMTITSTR